MKKSWIMKVLCVSFVTVLLVASLAACGNSGNGAEAKLTDYTGGVISAQLPDGWILKAGKDIDTVGYLDSYDYIFKASDVDNSAPTLQVTVAYQAADDIDSWKGWISDGSFGEANDPFEVNGITWYTAKQGGVALIDGQVCLIYNTNGADFSDSEVQTILGNIKWK